MDAVIFFLDDQIPASDVCSCLFVSRAHFEASLVMISSYRGITPQVVKLLLTENAYFFQLVSTTKVKFVDKMKQSTYLCIVLHVQRKTKIHSLRFYLISNPW